MDYCDMEWFALEMKREHSIIFEIAPKYSILDSFVDYDGYSISSKGFLLTVKTDYNYGILRMEKVCVLVGVEGDGI